MRLGLIGYGTIATTLLGLMAEAGLKPAHLAVRVRPPRADAVRADLARMNGIADTVEVVTDADALLAARCDLVAECAGHGAVREDAARLLGAGTDVVIVSIGALADDALFATLRNAAQAGGARMILPAGAVGGVDLVAALAAAGDLHLSYRGTKPPGAWAGSPAEQVLDLNALTGPATFFSGSARDAARQYPKNANVAATLALAGAGFDATRVELVADPDASGNVHAFDLTSPLANVSMRIENKPSPGNAKTSLATVYSVLREIRNAMSPVAI